MPMSIRAHLMNKFKSIKFFEGLNSLRFFAAFLVVMHHSETIRRKNGLYNLEWLGLFRNGNNAVTFFFVLSGFLITYLLLKENFETKTISIRNFYIKRMLRIWPLYFLLVVIGCLMLPQVFNLLHVKYEMPYTFGQTWFYFLFFLPGLVTFFFGHHFLEPLWSIGVEEVFYLIWAPLFKLFKKDNILPLLLSVLVVKVVLMILAQYFIKNELFGYVVNMLSFEAMAIGGLGAYWVFHRTAPVSEVFIYKLPAQVVIYLLLGVHIVFYNNIDNVFWNALFKTPIVSQLFVDLLFLYLMIGTSLVDNNIIKLRSKALSYLGEISYGIYMYHMLVIFAIIQFLKRYLVGLSPLVSTLGFYAILTLLVIVVAGVSKATFENYFLGLKKKLHKNQKA